MAETKSLHEAFIDELRDTYDAERQLTKALGKMAKAASSDDLRQAFDMHLQETEGHIQRLEQVFETFGEKVRGKRCEGMAGIIEEGKSVMEEEFDDATMDACLIAAAQRAEHYEMAAYGTLVAWARAMGHDDTVELLEQILNEEKATDEKLSAIAEGGINEEAATSQLDADADEDVADDDEDADDEDADDDEDEDADDEDETMEADEAEETGESQASAPATGDRGEAAGRGKPAAARRR